MPTRISYDGMSRLTAAGFENGKLNNHFSTSYKYDLMGNILTLRREGLLDSGDYGTIDDLTYSYEGNQVVKIDDAADESPSYSGAMHFRDAANEETEYTYDANGNMLTDSNKGITSIDYNVLNLPQCINVKPNVLGNSDNKVCYTYSADGTKLRSTYKNGDSQVLPYRPKPSSSIKTNGMVTPMVRLLENNYYYCSNLVYNNDRLSTILFDGGYASVDEGGGIAMHFYVKDHLGSNRLVVDGNGNIEEVNHYYPFGALMGDRCGVSRNKYKYIGKELDTMYGWNMQDHEARWYDPIVGRWMVTDPLQEKYYDISTYCYAYNHPTRYVDPTGMEGWLSDWWKQNNVGTRLLGCIQMAGGSIEAVGGGIGGILTAETGVGLAGGFALLLHGADNTYAGAKQMLTGKSQTTYTYTGTKYASQKLGASEETAEQIATTVDVGTSLAGGGSGLYKSNRFVTGRLQKHVNQAVKEVDSEGLKALTPKQLRAVQKNSRLYPAYRGNRIDVRTRQKVGNDIFLKWFDIKSNYTNGPDFTHRNKWWDMTTPAQWQKHVNKYGKNGTLLNTAPKR